MSRKNDNCDWAEITFGSIDSVTYAISGLRGQRLPGSERRCRVDYAFTQEGAEKIGTFSSLSAYHERRARESGSMRELHSALGDCWEGSFEVKKNPIPCRLSLIGIFYQKVTRNSGESLKILVTSLGWTTMPNLVRLMLGFLINFEQLVIKNDWVAA